MVEMIHAETHSPGQASTGWMPFHPACFIAEIERTQKYRNVLYNTGIFLQEYLRTLVFPSFAVLPSEDGWSAV